MEELVIPYGVTMQDDGAWCPKIVPLKLNQMEAI